MADKTGWVDRMFGTGIVIALLPIGVALWGMYDANSKSDRLESQLEDQMKLRDELRDELRNAEHGLKELGNRIVKLEIAQAIAQAVTKVEAKGAEVQATVAQLKTEYNTPQQMTLLSDFSQQFTKRQRTWTDILKESPADASVVKSLPPPPTLPSSLDFLNESDKTSLDSILVRTRQNWNPPTPELTYPGIDWKRLEHSPLLEKEKSFPEKVWDLVKAYPSIVILLVLFLIGSVLKK